MPHACSIFWSCHLWHNWTKHININFIIFNVPKVREEWIKFWFCWCFPTNIAHALDLYLVFMSRTYFKQSVGKDSWLSNFYKCSEPIKPKTKLKIKMGLAKGGDITIRGSTTRILLFRANRGIWSINFTRRSSVRITYNTEPSPKELTWGRSTPVYLGKYSFPFCFSFGFF